MEWDLKEQIDRMSRIRHAWQQIAHTPETRRLADEFLEENQQAQRRLLDWEIALLDWKARDIGTEEQQ